MTSLSDSVVASGGVSGAREGMNKLVRVLDRHENANGLAMRTRAA
jgi:hypothetical protein